MSNKEIDEAIKELREDREHPTADYTPKLKAAEQLGIEALERERFMREYSGITELLPSETKE